jgi:hypothetical protein
MPEPSKINTVPFHRREESKLLHLQLILDDPIVPPYKKELTKVELLDNLYYILDSSTTNLERMSVRMCIDKVKKYLGQK